MSFEYWLAFILASAVILAVPGPTIILVVSQAAAHGKKSILPLALGVFLGDFTAITCSMVGLGAIIATSSALFTIFKWIGAGYLIYLGIKAWLQENQTSTPNVHEHKSNWALLKNSFLVTAFNPKSIAFFIAFLPQFIVPERSANPQMLILACTFLSMATLNAFIYALFASKMNALLKKKNKGKWLNRAGGTTLIGAGLLTAAMKQQ